MRVGNKCNRVKGHGKIDANEVIKNSFDNKNYRLMRKPKSTQQEINRLYC